MIIINEDETRFLHRLFLAPCSPKIRSDNSFLPAETTSSFFPHYGNLENGTSAMRYREREKFNIFPFLFLSFFLFFFFFEKCYDVSPTSFSFASMLRFEFVYGIKFIFVRCLGGNSCQRNGIL